MESAPHFAWWWRALRSCGKPPPPTRPCPPLPPFCFSILLQFELVCWRAAAHQNSPAAICNSRHMAQIKASMELQDYTPAVRKRKVVEHAVLFQMKEGFSEVQEKDMLDHLYTLQYQLRGIIAVSLGSITNQNTDGCTHGLFMRFPSTEALQSYYDSPARWKVANEYIIPYYNGLICIDFEAEVEDDIEPIFRRGEAFEQGVESLIFLQVKSDTDPKLILESFDALSCLVEELGTLVVQHTSGVNICDRNKGYTMAWLSVFPQKRQKIFLHNTHLF